MPLGALIEVKPRLIAYLKVRQTQTLELAAKYGKVIEARLNKAADAGDLKTAEAFQEEKERLGELGDIFVEELKDPVMTVKKGATLPELGADVPEALVGLRKIWTVELQKIRIKLDGDLQKSLKKVETDFTKAGDFKNAKQVLLYRESLLSSSPGESSLAEVPRQTGNPFREIYPRREYDKRLKAAGADIESSIHLATKTRQPAVGLKLIRVSEELSAENPGMQIGSILVKQGNRKSWARYLPTKLVMPSRYTAHFIDADDNDQMVRLQPGLQKVTYSRVYRPDIAYLRNEIGKRDPRWDRHMVLAGFAFATNAKLTETALHHAIEAGYQEDALTDFYRVV